MDSLGMNKEARFRLVGVTLLTSFIFAALVLSSVFASGQNRPRTAQPQPPKPNSAVSASTTTQQTQRPTATPTPRPATPEPTLGEAPPVPRLKPTPTPTPPEEIDPESTLKINTDLVSLHVRVIDRNNRPIDNVTQNEFHVFEDGVPQPIESFSREEVPISYGLAVDTSGSLRTQLQSVIDAGKTIINSNKKGDETFLVRFISSDKIETVQDFTDKKDLLMDGLDSFYIEVDKLRLSMRFIFRQSTCLSTGEVTRAIVEGGL